MAKGNMDFELAISYNQVRLSVEVLGHQALIPTPPNPDLSLTFKILSSVEGHMYIADRKF